MPFFKHKAEKILYIFEINLDYFIALELRREGLSQRTIVRTLYSYNASQGLYE